MGARTQKSEADRLAFLNAAFQRSMADRCGMPEAMERVRKDIALAEIEAKRAVLERMKACSRAASPVVTAAEQEPRLWYQQGSMA